MSPHTLEKTGTRHTDEQWKVEGGRKEGGEKPLNAPYKMLLLLATPLNKPYNPKHKESDACACMTKPLTTMIIITGHSCSYLLHLTS